jgi:hypothetical protein
LIDEDANAAADLAGRRELPIVALWSVEKAVQNIALHADRDRERVAS